MIDPGGTEATVETAKRTILLALAERPGRTIGELADQTGVPPAVVRAGLRELSRHGVVWQPLSGFQAGRWRLVTRPGPSPRR